MPQSLPLSLLTTYQDLLDRHRFRPRPDPEGSILLVGSNGLKYWVARQRIGDRVVEKRIGPDNDENRAISAKLKSANDSLAGWRRDTGTLVAQLRAAGAPTPSPGTGKLINAMERVGFFRSGGVLAGTHAFGLYELELGVRLEQLLAMTEDVDVVADRSVHLFANQGISLVQSLNGLGLQPVQSPMSAHPVRWRTEDGILLDVLSPRGRGGQDAVHLKGLGVWGQALPFIEFALKDPIDAVLLYREGILVRVPAPWRYAVHKLIVASLRTGIHAAKSTKDRAQAAVLIEAMHESRPHELGEAYRQALATGPAWSRAISASLEHQPKVKAWLDSL